MKAHLQPTKEYKQEHCLEMCTGHFIQYIIGLYVKLLKKTETRKPQSG